MLLSMINGLENPKQLFKYLRMCLLITKSGLKIFSFSFHRFQLAGHVWKNPTMTSPFCANVKTLRRPGEALFQLTRRWSWVAELPEGVFRSTIAADYWRSLSIKELTATFIAILGYNIGPFPISGTLFLARVPFCEQLCLQLWLHASVREHASA